MYPYRGNTEFKQYNPNKPAKYGLLYRSLCERKLKAQLQSITSPELTSIPNISATRYCNFQGMNISTDRYFTSVSSWALEKNIIIVGTIKHDRKGIPKELKPVSDREKRSAMHVYNIREKTVLVSYIYKKKSGKKNAIVLSTKYDNVKITKDQRKKPSVHTMHDHTKGVCKI